MISRIKNQTETTGKGKPMHTQHIPDPVRLDTSNYQYTYMAIGELIKAELIHNDSFSLLMEGGPQRTDDGFEYDRTMLYLSIIASQCSRMIIVTL